MRQIYVMIYGEELCLLRIDSGVLVAEGSILRYRLKVLELFLEACLPFTFASQCNEQYYDLTIDLDSLNRIFVHKV